MISWKDITAGIDRRFGGSAIINFLAILALFVFIFILHRVEGGIQNDGIGASKIATESPQVFVDDTISSHIDLAAILMPNTPITKPQTIEPVKKVTKEPIQKKSPTICVQKKKQRRPKLVRRKKRRSPPSIRKRESQVSIEELDGESARMHYIALNDGRMPEVKLRKLPTVEDLDGESARLHYISENKRLANNDPTRK